MKRINPARYPKYRMKYALDPLFKASDFTGKMPRAPENVIFVYYQALAESISGALGLSQTEEPYGNKLMVRNYTDDSRSLYVMMPGAGASMTATVADELHSLGARNFLILGAAGSLSERAKINDVVLCSKALRDEGVSYHLLPSALYSYPSPDLVSHLRASMRKAGMKFLLGPTWTVEFPYAETIDEVRAYRNAGIITVEMEAAALFALAKVRRFNSAAVFTISDTLSEDGWSGMSDITAGMEKLTEIARIFRVFH